MYVGDEDGKFHALSSARGKPIWRFRTDGKIISSATVTNGAVLFGSYDSKLYCLDARTGKKRWTLEADSYVHASPCVAGKQTVIAGCDGNVRMIDLATGKQASAVETDGNFAAGAAYDDGRVFLGDMGGQYFAIRSRDAEVLWTVERKDDPGSYASAAVRGDAVVFASRSGEVFRLNGRASPCGA